jgi:dCTP deaminase
MIQPMPLFPATMPATSSAQLASPADCPSSFGMMPSQVINWLLETNQVLSDSPIEASQIQPASLDLRLGLCAYRVRASFLPGKSTSVRERLKDLSLHRIDLTRGAVLEAGSVYVAELLEHVDFGEKVSALGNPKSSTGRLDVFTRLIVDFSGEFDRVPEQHTGRLFLEISPRTFPILARTGSRLTQLRFRRGARVSSSGDVTRAHKEASLVDGSSGFSDGAFGLSIDLRQSGPQSVVGYRAKRHSGLINVDLADEYNPAEYWEPVTSNSRANLILDPNEFYILVSKEHIRVPPDYAAELMPYDPVVGEFRVHYAGFFDPGFGHSFLGPTHSRAVLEVRSHEVPFVLEDAQIVGRLRYERLMDAPTVSYGEKLGSNYQGQGLRLSKHFKAWDGMTA